MATTTSKALPLLLLLLVVFAMPAMVSDYQLFQFTMVVVMALAVLGLNLLLGLQRAIVARATARSSPWGDTSPRS